MQSSYTQDVTLAFVAGIVFAIVADIIFTGWIELLTGF